MIQGQGPYLSYIDREKPQPFNAQKIEWMAIKYTQLSCQR